VTTSLAIGSGNRCPAKNCLSIPKPMIILLLDLSFWTVYKQLDDSG